MRLSLPSARLTLATAMLLAGAWPAAAQVHQQTEPPRPAPRVVVQPVVVQPAAQPVSAGDVLNQLRARGTPDGRIAAATRGIGPQAAR